MNHADAATTRPTTTLSYRRALGLVAAAILAAGCTGTIDGAPASGGASASADGASTAGGAGDCGGLAVGSGATSTTSATSAGASTASATAGAGGGAPSGGDAGGAGGAAPSGGAPVFTAQGTVFDVTKYGAPADGNGDATSGVSAAIAASHCGDTILFPKGTYRFGGEVSWPGCRMYLGEDGATLTGHGPYGTLVAFHDAHDLVVQNLTWAGGGMFLERQGGASSEHVVIDNNVFHVATSCSAGHDCNLNAIYFTTRLASSRITNNLFSDFASGSFAYGLLGYCYADLVVANNELVGIPAGMHVDAQGGPGACGPAVFEQNYFSDIGRSATMSGIGPGMELQSSPDHVTLQDNWFEHPSLSSAFHENDYSYAYSVPLGGSTNTLIRRNVVIAPERPDGTGCRIGFEVGGVNTVVEENYLAGINAGIADTDGYGTQAAPHLVTARHNHIEDALQPLQASGNPWNKLDSIDNGPNATMSWDVGRGRPRRNARFPGT
jgi:hypothetical protein